MKVVTVVVVVMVGVACQAFTFPPEHEVQNEDACLQEGGVCELESDCPKIYRTTSGLCPSQQAYGVECCRTVPSINKDCREKWGVCISAETCGNAPTDLNSPCPANQVCCLIVD